MSPAQRPAPRRERARAATIDEIKQTALVLMHEHGPAGIRFADIARAMDMTPPALYRYFADRDQLLNALITDAYDAMARWVAEARDAVPVEDAAGRWMAVAQAYRAWARQEPHQFTLILGQPIPGFATPVDGPTTEAASRALSQMSALFVEAIEQGALGRPLLRNIHPWLAACIEAKNTMLCTAIPPDTYQAMLHAWAMLHGFTTLEVYGHLDWMDPQARDVLFVGQIQLAAYAAGLPMPEDPLPRPTP